ncbi:hypothetical protein [Bacillus coahuilensis]|nr:hypothetical protein [Bacillus coahuilensis]
MNQDERTLQTLDELCDVLESNWIYWLEASIFGGLIVGFLWTMF